jgi:hypothetical protein
LADVLRVVCWHSHEQLLADVLRGVLA